MCARKDKTKKEKTMRFLKRVGNFVRTSRKRVRLKRVGGMEERESKGCRIRKEPWLGGGIDPLKRGSGLNTMRPVARR